MKLMQLFSILSINFKEISIITFFIIVFSEIFIKFKICLQYTQNYLLEAFSTLAIHINHLHSNIKYRTILYFYHNHLCICY